MVVGAATSGGKKGNKKEKKTKPTKPTKLIQPSGFILLELLIVQVPICIGLVHEGLLWVDARGHDPIVINPCFLSFVVEVSWGHAEGMCSGRDPILSHTAI